MPDAEAFATGFGRYEAQRHDPAARSVEGVESLVEETPVTLNYNGQAHAVMLATPTDLDDFAVGFSLTEGIVARAAEIGAVDVIPSRHGVALMITIPDARAAGLVSLRRSLPGMGGCGLCGVENLQAALRRPDAVCRDLRLAPAAIAMACRSLPALQTLGARTGASHAAAFVRADGAVLVVREDAARHIALDKLVGHLARNEVAIGGGFVLLTSRASYELVQKAATAGFELVVAVSAPTGLAVRLARDTGVTLLGFARDGRFTCYANEFRLEG